MFNKSSIDYIIVGLGNPESKYDNTRHNAGFIAIDNLAKNCGGVFNKNKFHAIMCDIIIEGKRCLLVKPLTYMNNSGLSVSEVSNFYKVKPSNIIVIYDDISLKTGLMRIRTKGSAGGHNGIKSIIEDIGSQDFPRIKLGVGQKPHPDYNLADWVLSNFSNDEKIEFLKATENCVTAVKLMINNNVNEAMNKFNS
ncbi:MAG: aminoacyl-tRNA hydrolase [Oscillospiraceae bacterium]